MRRTDVDNDDVFPFAPADDGLEIRVTTCCASGINEDTQRQYHAERNCLVGSGGELVAVNGIHSNVIKAHTLDVLKIDKDIGG